MSTLEILCLLERQKEAGGRLRVVVSDENHPPTVRRGKKIPLKIHLSCVLSLVTYIECEEPGRRKERNCVRRKL